MKHTPLAIVLLLAATLTAGCASTPPTFYTLDMRSTGNATSNGDLIVDHVTINDTLAGGALPVKATPTELEYYHAAQWAGNLSEMVEEKFAAEYGPLDTSSDNIYVDLTLHAFQQQDISETEAEAYAKAEAKFRAKAMSRYDDPLKIRVYEHTEPMAEPTASALAEALSRCIEAIAVEIAADAAGVTP